MRAKSPIFPALYSFIVCVLPACNAPDAAPAPPESPLPKVEVTSRPAAVPPPKAEMSVASTSTETVGLCKGLDLAITVDQAECIDRKFGVADSALNVEYKSLMQRLAEPDRAALRTSQRAWLREKKQRCDNAAEEVRGGTLEAIITVDCHTTQTEERLRYLATYEP